MPRVAFTKNLERHVACPSDEVAGATLLEALEAYFERHPGVRTYVFDEQGELRHHVVVFVDGQQSNRDRLDQAISAHAEIYVMQALSGG